MPLNMLTQPDTAHANKFTQAPVGPLALLLVSLLALGLALAAGCSSTPIADTADATAKQVAEANEAHEAAQSPEPTPAPPPPPFDQIIQPGDRVLFVGDQITQQMYYTRAVAAGLLAIEPTHGLRFFNGGKNDATAGDAVQWIDELMVLTRPTVVFVMFGLNDGRAQVQGAGEGEGEGDAAEQYQKNLSLLLDYIQGYKQVREVFVVSPPAVASGLEDPMNIRGYNVTLHRLAVAAQQTAKEKQARYVDMYDPLIRLYLGAMRVEGPAVALGSELPGEPAHMVIASVLLRACGVTPELLEPAGWSPLRPLEMRRVRDTLAIDVEPPTLEQAQASRAIYLAITRHDEKFFRAWRIAPRKSTSRGRATLMSEADQVWASIAAAAAETYGKPAAE